MHSNQFIDHLVYTSTSLAEGKMRIKDLLGVEPVTGGQHPQWGTHNALLSLGTSYLEIIAPNREQPAPPAGRLFEAAYHRKPQLTTWALRSTTIANDWDNWKDAGLTLGDVRPAQRSTPKGELLKWELSDPYALPWSGLAPFLIDWGNTPHPSTRLPQAGTIAELRLEHPDPKPLQLLFDQVGLELIVNQGSEPKLLAKIMTSRGTVGWNKSELIGNQLHLYIR